MGCLASKTNDYDDPEPSGPQTSSVGGGGPPKSKKGKTQVKILLLGIKF